jgi:hypothetical protein
MSFETANDFVTSFIQDFLSRSEDNEESLMESWNRRSSDFKKIFKKTKAKKDKNAPKKNSSAYIFFCNDKRPEVKEKHPELKNNEILKELGLLWKKFKDEKPNEVKKYEKKAADDKERYQDEMKNYVPCEVEEEPKEKKSRKKKAVGEPKKGKSAYLFFCADERIKIKEEKHEMEAKDVLAELGARWKLFKDENPEGVKEYEQMAADDKVRYEEEMKNYVPAVVDVADNKKTKKKKASDEPKKGKSAYIFFCADERPIVKEENPEMPAKEILAELGARWKKLSDKDKEKYNQLAAEDKLRFEEEKKNYVPKDEDPNEKVIPKKKAVPKKKQRKVQPIIEDDDDEVEKTNEDIVKDIIDNFEGDTVTKKAIKEELKKRGVEIAKDELNEIISKLYN